MGSPIEAQGGFTPGPWLPLFREGKVLISSNVNSDGVLIDPAKPSNNGGIYVAHVIGPDRVANARLIAASPDLLEALVNLEMYLRLTVHHNAIEAAAARAAIAKATGGVA